MGETTMLGMPAVKQTRPPRAEGARYFVRTFGCQMNEHDSERIGGSARVRRHGRRSTDPDDADVVVLNTCTIRENADQKLYGYLGAMKAIKGERPGMQIMVGGCMAQKDREVIQDRAGWVDVVFGTHNTHRVLDLLDHAEEWGPVTEIWEETAPSTTSRRRCPATAKPNTRPGSRSRSAATTRARSASSPWCGVARSAGARATSSREVRQLAAEGVVEVTLLGQNVNSYGRDLEHERTQPVFADLLRRVGEVEGIRRIRYTSPHPKDFQEDVAVAMAETPAVVRATPPPAAVGKRPHPGRDAPWLHRRAVPREAGDGASRHPRSDGVDRHHRRVPR